MIKGSIPALAGCGLTRRLLMAAAPVALVAGAAPAPDPHSPIIPSRAPPFPVLDAGSVPHLDAAGRQAYRHFLLMGLPRAFALSDDGRYGAAGGALSLYGARTQALAACQAAGGRNGRIYAEDLEVVWMGPAAPGENPQSALPAQNAQPAIVETWNYSFAPDARFFWRGPQAAAGVYVWAHGSTADPHGLQPPPHVRAFNNAGYDIVRFDREPNADDVDRAAQWLRAGLRRMRAMGWRRVVAGGHSRGAWNVLQMLKTADLADLAIVESPAAHGVASGFFMSSQTDDLRQIVDDVPQTRTKLAFIQFRDDPFIGDADTRLRLIGRLRPRLGGLLTIDRPPGFSGHLAAAGLDFAVEFSGALLALA